MNHGINITLIIVGIMALTLGPLGVVILTIAYFSIRSRHKKHQRYEKALEAEAAIRERRLRILAFKSLP